MNANIFNKIFDNKISYILIIAFIYKAAQYFIISPELVNESGDYILISANFFNASPEFFALRVWLYPFFIKIISAFSDGLKLIVIVQLFLSICSIGLTYLIVKEIANIKAALIASLLLLFSPTGIFDSCIAPESLTIFLNILLLFFFIKALKTEKIMFTILSGVVLTLLIFTRPQYLLFVPAICVYLLITKRHLENYLIAGIPLIISLLWMFEVKNVTGIFNMTTLSGYNLINHTGKFIEKAPAEYDIIKTVYIKAREENLIMTGTESGTIWMVRDTLQTLTHTDKTGLSAILTGISYYLIFHYPVQYLRSVWASLSLSLIVPDQEFRLVNNNFIFRLFLPFYQLIIGFGFISGIAMLWKRSRVKNYEIYLLMLILIIANLLAGSLFDYASNGRFFVPVYYILFIWSSIMFLCLKDSASQIVNK